MTTVLSIDVLEQVPAMYSGTLPRLTVRRWEGDELPPADLTVIVARSLAPHLVRQALAEASERLCTAEVPNVRSAYRRNAAA